MTPTIRTLSALVLALPAVSFADEAPFPSTPSWSVLGPEEYAFFGEAIAFAGDVDGDGYDDLLLGAPNADTSLDIQNDGRVFLHRGGPDGPEAVASWSAASGVYNAEMGSALAAAGDVNGDGKADFLAGGHWANTVNLWLGAEGGPSVTPDWTYTDLEESFSEFGISVAGIGDVNDDGFDDIAIGACYCMALEGNGRVFVFLGSASGITGQPIVIEATSHGTQFGISVAAAGDLNGDGFDDLLVGADYAPFTNDANGEAYLFLGGITGPSTMPVWTMRGSNTQDRFGWALAAVRDWDGDGKPDIAVGAHNYGSGGFGRLFTFAGGNGLAQEPSWTADGPMDGASLGYALANAGDVNGDGYDDLLSGGDTYQNGEFGEGAAFLFLGGPAASSAPVWSLEGNQVNAGYGAAVAAGGDVNGDGAPDILVGAPYWSVDEDQFRGKVELFLGTPHATPTEEPKPGDSAEGGEPAGCACSLGSAAAPASWPVSLLLVLGAALVRRRR